MPISPVTGTSNACVERTIRRSSSGVWLAKRRFFSTNIAISQKYLKICAENEIILEVEAGVVGGEEDGSAGTDDMPEEKLYTTPEDMLAVHEALHPIGHYTFAATFGNVHGHYKPGAVKLRPNDGYIVDSLGWGYYRLGNFKKAVRHLERAAELRPQDPIINDHLGDAYWRVGRTREAKFQWNRSLSLDPEDDLIAKIRQKMKTGLAEDTETAKKSPDDG